MSRYYTDEDKEKAAKRLAEDHREAAQLFTVIRPVITEFDGKVYNCRFEKALQDKTGRRIYCRKECGGKWLTIYYYSKNFNQQMTIAGIKIEDMMDGKRINAARFLESGRERYTEHLQQAAKLEEAIEKAPEIERQILELAKMINVLSSQIDSYEAREIFDLNYRITNY